ncbi:MAG TPA: imidazole glycerol phosphate synthase subunit HisH [Candidatus Ratteibacteria bacterium]|nr:imidazole glycerol phosphate synthase subunit HisH [bacterium]HPC28960.1 imidazole glycerol phosphate synthase subunit HisH [bacterium]HRS05630.1 imidazole glycerol phosphate synthase subunit HisH [Candidatus Ratteibacteria bacterium]HRV03753.1 imidazole glycerol phosphate synthase subunit HisH [Candidatus Ratteibacteria bacterium]
MTGIIHYGAGNIFSIINCLDRCGERVLMISHPDRLKKVERIVLPGVGAFDRGIEYLKKTCLYQALKDESEKGKPILGICLGLQMFFEESEEGKQNGLGLLPGFVRKFPKEIKFPVPHMGWNTVRFYRNSRISNKIPAKSSFYFAHSFYAIPQDKKIISGTTTYGIKFASVVEKNNIIGVQFHPEKSAKNGFILIQNFLKI